MPIAASQSCRRPGSGLKPYRPLSSRGRAVICIVGQLTGAPFFRGSSTIYRVPKSGGTATPYLTRTDGGRRHGLRSRTARCTYVEIASGLVPGPGADPGVGNGRLLRKRVNRASRGRQGRARVSRRSRDWSGRRHLRQQLRHLPGRRRSPARHARLVNRSCCPGGRDENAMNLSGYVRAGFIAGSMTLVGVLAAAQTTADTTIPRVPDPPLAADLNESAGRPARRFRARTFESRGFRPGPRHGDRPRQGALLGHAGRERRRAGLRELPFPRRRGSALPQPGQSRAQAHAGTRSHLHDGQRPQSPAHGLRLSAQPPGNAGHPGRPGSRHGQQRRRLVARHSSPRQRRRSAGIPGGRRQHAPSRASQYAVDDQCGVQPPSVLGRASRERLQRRQSPRRA